MATSWAGFRDPNEIEFATQMPASSDLTSEIQSSQLREEKVGEEDTLQSLWRSG